MKGKMRKGRRLLSLLLALTLCLTLMPSAARAEETPSSDGGPVSTTLSEEGEVGSESDGGEDDGEPVGSYTVSIALPEGVETAEDSGELKQSVSAESEITPIRIVSGYADEPFESDMADVFNTRLFAGTGLTASCGEGGVITIGGTPAADVDVNLADAFAEDEPATVADTSSAVYVSSTGDDSSGDGSESNPYATISKAYEAVGDDGTIYLLSNVDVSSKITFGTAKTVTITSADSSNKKTIFSKCIGLVQADAMMLVTEGEVIFTNITLDGSGQKDSSGTTSQCPGCIHASGGTVTLETGTTIQNFKKDTGTGGGCAVINSKSNGSSKVYIKDGVLITKCELTSGITDDPAAVLCSGSGAYMYMTGGEITGNTLSTTQTNTTAVVNIGKHSNPHFWMTGGKITGNTINNGAAAVYMRGAATACDIEFGGTAYVYDNYVNGESGDQRNIYLKNASDTTNSIYVKLCSTLTTGAKLGVYAEKIGMGTKVAQGGGINGNTYTATAEDTTYFVSDKETDAEILYCGGSAETCGLLQHRSGDTNHNGGVSAIYLSVSPAVTATKGDDKTLTLSIERCASDATYVVLDKDMKPVTGKTLDGGTYETDGTFKLTNSTTTIKMPGLEKDSGPYTVMLVGDGGLTLTDGKAATGNLTDIATVNIVNFAGEGVRWSDDTNDFENGGFDIVIVPHNDQTGKANKSYTATAKVGYTFAAENAITASGNLGDETVTDNTNGSKTIAVEVPAYGATNYTTVTLTGTADATGGISIDVGNVTGSGVGTLSESLTVTLHITDTNAYEDGKTPTYKYTVTNRLDSSDKTVTGSVGASGEGTYSISGLKYGDHVKVYADGAEDAAKTYFKVLNTSLENGGFENNDYKKADLKTGVNMTAWHTTANDEKMEVYDCSSYGVGVSPNGGYMAELNAYEASSLYQEISTEPGRTLGWTMYHTARKNGNAAPTQQMAIVIGPTLDATDADPYKKTDSSDKDMFMTIAAKINSPVAGETYYTEYNGKTYQVTIASATTSDTEWKNYSGTYTVPERQKETVFAFASLGASSAVGNLIDGVGFGADVAITEVKAAKNGSDKTKVDISIENSTKSGVYVVLDKDMKPVTGKTLSGGTYATDGKTFKLSDADSTTTIKMPGLDKSSGPYTVMRVVSGSLSVDSTTGKAATSNLTDIATVNIVNFAGAGVAWSDGTNSFENGDFDIVIVPHNDQTGKANKSYTATAKVGYAFAAGDAITASGNLGNKTIKDNTDGSKTIAVEVPAYGATSKGTSGYNTVTLTGETVLNTGVKLLDKTGGTEMTEGKTYDGVAVAYTEGTVSGATYTWQKKDTNGSYSDIESNTAPSDAGDYNLKVTVSESSTQNLPFTISPKGLTVTATANDKTYDGEKTATLKSASLTGVLEADKSAVSLGSSKITVAFEDKNAGDSKTVKATFTEGALSGDKAGNYTIASATAANAKISPATVTATITAKDKVYDGTNTAEVTKVELAGLVNGETVTATASDAHFAGLNACDNQTVTATITLDNSEKAKNYTVAATATTTASITAKQLDVTVNADNKQYDGTTDATATVTLAENSGIVGSDRVTLNTSDMKATFNDAAVGNGKTVTITGLSLDGDAAGNYKLPDTITGTANITKAGSGSGTVTLDGWTYGETAKTPTATSTTNPETATYQYKVKGAEDTAYTNDVPTNAGEYTVKATFPANDNYGATTATADFTISPKALTVSVTAMNKEYDGTANATLSDATLNGIATADTGKVTLGTSGVTASFDNKNVGENKSVTLSGSYTLSGDAAKNYTVTQPTGLKATITAATLTISSATVTSKTYDGDNDATITAVAFDGLKNSETLVLGTDYTVSDAKYDSANAGGDNKATFNVVLINTTTAKNYVLTTTAGSQSATISKADHGNSVLSTTGKRGETNTFDGLSAYVVDGGMVGTVTTNENSILDGVPTYDSNTGKLTYTLKSDATEGQTATVTLPVTSANYENYNIVVTVGVTPKETVEIGITAQNFGYDGTAQAPTGITVTEDKVAVSALEVTYEGTDGTTYAKTGNKPTNAGKYIMTVKVPDSNTTYTGSATCNFEITKKALTAAITAQNKTYDGNTTATVTPTLDGVVEGDSGKVTANVTTPVFENKNVGENKKVTASISLTGEAAGNYTVNGTAETAASISIKEVSITGVTVAYSKPYDRTATATITDNGTISGKVETDKLSITAGTASYDNADVGTNKTVSFTGFALAGEDANNYTLTGQPASTTAAITAKEVTISGVTVEPTKVYDGNANAKITNYGALTGVVDGDTVTIKTGTAAYDNRDAGENKTVTFSGFGIEGADAGNYTLTQPTGLTASISKKTLTVTPTDVSVTRGTTPTFELSYDGVVSGESVTLTDPTYTVTNSSGDKVTLDSAIRTAGIYSVTVSGTLAGDTAQNYEYASGTGTLTVKKPSSGSGSTAVDSGKFEVPVSGDKTEMKIEGEISGNTVVVSEVTKENIATVGEGENVVVELEGLNKNINSAKLTVGTLENVLASEAKGLEVRLPNAIVTIDRTTLNALTEQAIDDLQLVVEPDEAARKTLNSAQKESVSELVRPTIIEAFFTSFGNRIGDFKGGEVSVSVPFYTDKPIRAWYLKEDGSREKVGAVYDKVHATLTLTHFSHYAIEEMENEDYDVAYASCPKDATCPIEPFPDAVNKEWYHDGCHFCIDNGLMVGFPDGNFYPYGDVTRAQVVTILWKLEGSLETNDAMNFADVPDGKWFTEAIRWATSNGVVTGYSDKAFGPNDAITREQFASILWRYSKLKGYDVSVGEDTNILDYDDAPSISSYAVAAMQWACGSGMIYGMTADTLVPSGVTSRAQAATMFMRYCAEIVK